MTLSSDFTIIMFIMFTNPSSAFLAGPSNNTGSTSLSQNHNGYARPFQVYIILIH